MERVIITCKCFERRPQRYKGWFPTTYKIEPCSHDIEIYGYITTHIYENTNKAPHKTVGGKGKIQRLVEK